MALQSIGQQRASQALEWMQQVERDNAENDKRKELKEKLKAAAESFAPLILMSGLGQAAAFYKSKGGPHQQLYGLLSDWLCSPGRPFAQGEGDMLERLVKAGQSDYRAAQAEALAFLQWVKKFAKAYGEA